jgi:pilus assembly protein CpaC
MNCLIKIPVITLVSLLFFVSSGLSMARSTGEISAGGVSMNPASESLAEGLTLFMGEVKVLTIPSITKVAMGNAKLVSASVLPNDQLLLLAEEQGETVMHLWLEGGEQLQFKIRVNENDLQQTLGYLNTLLADTPHIRVREVGGQIFVEGRVDPADKHKITILSQTFPKVVDLTNISDMTMRKMVLLDVKIMEFSNTSLSRLGIDWSGGFPANGPGMGIRTGRFPLPDAGGGSGSNIAANFNPTRAWFGLASEVSSTLNAMITGGEAVMIASPRLSTRSGGEASFLAGGQIPLPSMNATGQSSVEFKDYGIKLSFKPVTDHLDNILVKVDTEVSLVDKTNEVQGIPGILSRRSATEVNVKNGEMMVISGLVDQQASHNNTKIPLLGDIPLLGELFKYREESMERKELVVFVVATVVDPQSSEFDVERQRIEEAQQRVEIGPQSWILD